MLFGWIGFGRCVRSAQHDVSDNVGIHFGTMLGTEEEVPEAEDEEKLHAITTAISRPSFDLPGETLLVFIAGKYDGCTSTGSC